MIITIQPTDIIKRCLWLEYKRFCLNEKTENEIKQIILDDHPIILSENDAYVIGLLKVVETPNLIHRFQQHLDEYLKIKSNIYEGKVYIVKSILVKEIQSFKDRFPSEFNPPFEFKSGLSELFEYVDKILDEIEKNIETRSITYNDKKYICVLSNQIKNLLE